MKLKVWRDPYDCGVSITRPKEIDINPGLTVLVGCNGAGKTTLLKNIQEQAKNEKIPCHMFNNLTDGGNSSIDRFLANMGTQDDLSMGILMYNSSEGEKIRLNVGQQAKLYKEFIKTGFFKDNNYKLQKIFADLTEKKEEETASKDRILLYDAVDSGMSIDAVQEIKNLFRAMIQEATNMGVNLYIIISANEYELTLDESCLDVISGRYYNFCSYSDFKRFILKSREAKEKRLDRQEKWKAKQKAKKRGE